MSDALSKILLEKYDSEVPREAIHIALRYLDLFVAAAICGTFAAVVRRFARLTHRIAGMVTSKARACAMIPRHEKDLAPLIRSQRRDRCNGRGCDSGCDCANAARTCSAVSAAVESG